MPDRAASPGGHDADLPSVERLRPMTFIVRTSGNEAGGIVGTVEHVRSGRKERFAGVEAISGVIAALIRHVDERSGTADPPG